MYVFQMYEVIKNAARAGVNELCMLTISDLAFEGVAATPMERQTIFTKMMEIALELI